MPRIIVSFSQVTALSIVRPAALDGLVIVGSGCRRAAGHPGWLWHYVGSARLVQRRCDVAPDGARCENSEEISGKSAAGIDRSARGILRNVAVRWLAQKTVGYVLPESCMRLREDAGPIAP